MDLVLAMDLKGGFVVHGKSGQRDSYKPLDWGCAPTAEPRGFLKAIAPKSVYIADLDRIGGTGSHDAFVRDCAQQVSHCYVDRGCRSPEDLLSGYHICNVIGTETAGENLSEYPEGFLSLDLRDGHVIPSGSDPVDMLKKANGWKFSGCVILNIAAVGTESGLDRKILETMRSVYHRRLFWGGGVASREDLALLHDAGFDGAIIATALHRGKIPLSWIRKGRIC